MENEIQETEKKEIVKNDQKDLLSQQIEQMDEIAKDVLESVDSDRDRADELYDFMRDASEVEADKNPATREAMAKALDLKMRGTDQKIALLRLKTQLLNPNKGGININLNVPGSGEFDEKKGRNTNDFISIVENIENELADESDTN